MLLDGRVKLDGIPADSRIVWISSASVRSPATATCTMLAIGPGLLSRRSGSCLRDGARPAPGTERR